MRIKNFTLPFLAFGLLLFFSCQQEETTTEINNTIAIEQLQHVLDTKEVTKVRFVSGILNNELIVVF